MKRLFAKKTANMEDGPAKTVAEKMKALQADAECLAKNSRKIKQNLKNLKDTSKVKTALKDLFEKNASFCSMYVKIGNELNTVIENLDNITNDSKLNAIKVFFTKATGFLKKIPKLGKGVKTNDNAELIAINVNNSEENKLYESGESEEHENPLFNGNE